MTENRPEAEQSQPPENIATVYSWANMHSAQYRDFSASRLQARAQFRRRILREQTEAAAKVEQENLHQEAAVAEASAARTIQSDQTHREPEPPWSTPRGTAPDPKTVGAITPGATFEEESAGGSCPQWLNSSLNANVPLGAPATGTLLGAKKSVASRWFALRGIFDRAEKTSAAPATTFQANLPMVVIFSAAGGVGKTSLAASLGRALAAYGERVLLVDTAPFGLLPYYFGARETKPGVIRTFSPPEGSSNAPVHALTVEAQPPLVEGEPDRLLNELRREGRGAHRILVDVQTAAQTVVLRLLRLEPTLLVPLLPDMSSVASLASVEANFAGKPDADAHAIRPIYILNQFDASLPLHVDVREILQQQLGDRLLPFAIRRSPEVSEALADGMTVMDYAPNAPVAADYLHLASWLRNVSSTPAAAMGGVRWSEQ